MEIKYRKELNSAYMILPEPAVCEDYGLRILQENHLEGVMPLTVRPINGEREYYFNITDARSLSRVLERRPVTFGEIRGLFEDLNRVMNRMDEYLMNRNHLILEPDLIYLKAGERRGEESAFAETVFCCHPAWEKDILIQLRELMQYFLNKMDHMDVGSVELAYELFHTMQKEYFRMDEILEICRREPSLPEPEESPGTGTELPEERDRRRSRRDPGRRYGRAGKAEPQTERWIGTGMMAGGGLLCAWNLWRYLMLGLLPLGLFFYSLAAGILLLGAGLGLRLLKREPVRLRHETGEREPEVLRDTPTLVSRNLSRQESLEIRQIPYHVGRKESGAEGALEWPTISRQHAQIRFKDGSYCVEDCCSKNGTYLNGERLLPSRDYSIKNGDEVAFADWKFIFRC